MTIQVTKSAKTLEEGVQNLIEGSKLDYAKWTEKGRAEGSSYYDETLANFEKNCSVREGQNYIKVIRENAVHAFVIKKLTAKTEAKGFKVGDILKPAGWQAPALNKARGNVLEGNFLINWTGPLYLS
jgi:hypothetical protein